MINLKKILCAALLAVLVLSVLPAQEFQPIDEIALEAFSVSFQAYVTGGMLAGFQQEVPGCSVTINGPEVTVAFDSWDLGILQLEEDFGFRTISGTIVSTESESGADMVADLTFAGGPVRELQWSVLNYEMSSDSDVVFNISADGKKYSLSYTDFMIQAQ